MVSTYIPFNSLLTERMLTHLYSTLNKTDKEIAKFFGVDRTYITKLRAELGIKSDENTGRKGEKIAGKALIDHGFEVVDMNLIDKLSPFDFLVNNTLRIEVKSATFEPTYGRYAFALSEQASNGNSVGDERIALPSGRTKKLFSKTCDFMIFVCIDDYVFYVIPSKDLPDDLTTLNIRPGFSKYEDYRNNWSLLIKNTRRQSGA